jgi:hypothetical protein
MEPAATLRFKTEWAAAKSGRLGTDAKGRKI